MHGNADALSRRDQTEEVEQEEELTEEDRHYYQELRVKPHKRTRLREKKREKTPTLPEPAEDDPRFLGVTTRRRTGSESRVRVSHGEGAEEIRDISRPTREDKMDTTGQSPVPRALETIPEETTGEQEAPDLDGDLRQAPAPDECRCGEDQGYWKAYKEMALQDDEDGFEWVEVPESPTPQISNLAGGVEVAKAQRDDPTLAQVREWIRRDRVPDKDELSTPALKAYARKLPYLEVRDGRICLKDEDRSRLCVPASMVPDVVRCLHHHPLAGHVGRSRCYLQARRTFYWPGMPTQISDFVSGCTACAKAKRRKPVKQVPLGQTSSVGLDRFDTFYADLVGPWTAAPKEQGGYRYLLTLTDAATKYPEAFPLKEPTAEAIVKTLMREFFPRYGVAFKIVTDRGRQFTSKLFQHAAQRLGLVTHQTQAYQPNSNPVERAHRTLEESMRALMAAEGANPNQWFKFTPYALAAMRQTPLADLPATPHFLVHGADAKTPAEAWTGHRSTPPAGMDIEKEMDRLGKVLEQVRVQQLENHQKNKEAYDAKVRPVELLPGDWCWLHTPQDTSQGGHSRKTATYQTGPYRVKAVLNDRQVSIAAKLQVGPGGETSMKEITVSRDRLTKAGRRDLAQIPAPFSWRIAGPRKVRVLQGPDVWPTPAAGASVWPETAQQVAVRGAPEGILVPRERPKDPPRPQSPLTSPRRQTPQRAPLPPPQQEPPAPAKNPVPPRAGANGQPRSIAPSESSMGDRPARGAEAPYQEEREERGMSIAGEGDDELSPLPLSSDDEPMRATFKRPRQTSESEWTTDSTRQPAAMKKERVLPSSSSPASASMPSSDDDSAPAPRPGFWKEFSSRVLGSEGRRPTGSKPSGGSVHLALEAKEQRAGTEKKNADRADGRRHHPSAMLRYALLSKNALPPVRRTVGSAGYDLAATERVIVNPAETKQVRTGLALQPPPGTYVQLHSRSGLARRYGLCVKAGVIDSDFRGEVTALIRNEGAQPCVITPGQYVCQAIVVQIACPPLLELAELAGTERGTKGWGSTDDGAVAKAQ